MNISVFTPPRFFRGSPRRRRATVAGDGRAERRGESAADRRRVENRRRTRFSDVILQKLYPPSEVRRPRYGRAKTAARAKIFENRKNFLSHTLQNGPTNRLKRNFFQFFTGFFENFPPKNMRREPGDPARPAPRSPWTSGSHAIGRFRSSNHGAPPYQGSRSVRVDREHCRIYRQNLSEFFPSPLGGLRHDSSARRITGRARAPKTSYWYTSFSIVALLLITYYR